MKYKAVLFDLDGTLINSVYDLADGVNYILKKYGYPQRTIEEVTAFVGNGLRRLIVLSLPEERPDIDAIVDEFKAYYFSNCCNKTVAYEGITDVLKILKNNGVKTAVVTNKPDFAAKEICGWLFKDLLDIVMGEHENMPRKPSAKMPEEVLKMLGVDKKDSIYVGDSEVDLLTAKNTGIDILSVSYGFRSREALIKAGAHIIVDKPVDMCEYLVDFCG